MSATATSLSLLEPFVSILIVDFAGFGGRESLVRFCYLDEFLFGCFVTSAGSR